MKKKIVLTLLAVIVGLFTFTGCSEDKPYSIYQIGTSFLGLEDILASKDPDKLSDADKDKLAVANYMAGWMIDNRFVMTERIGNPVIFEGDKDLTDQQNMDINDQQALIMYDNKVIELDKNDLNKIIIDAQNQTGKDKLTLKTSGSVDFRYYMTGLQPKLVAKKSYTITYSSVIPTP